jgi:hypothetical protein
LHRLRDVTSAAGNSSRTYRISAAPDEEFQPPVQVLRVGTHGAAADAFRLCDVRGPDGLTVELAEQINSEQTD